MRADASVQLLTQHFSIFTVGILEKQRLSSFCHNCLEVLLTFFSPPIFPGD